MCEFGFLLAESERESRRILRDETGHDLSEWNKVTRSYRENKSDLIRALDPVTGRRAVPYVHSPSPDVMRTKYRDSLYGGALRLARSRAADVEFAGDESRRLKANAIVNLLIDAEPILTRFANQVRDGEIDTGTVFSTDILQSFPEVKMGQRLSRALASVLRTAGLTADGASSVVDAIAQAAEIKPRSGQVILSANVFDILFCSEHAGYSSCHGLEGCHRAGPQQYLHDSHTIVAYYSEESRDWSGLKLPYKLWRAMVYVDAKRDSAAVQRSYGQRMPEDFHATVRREVARLLTALRDGECPAEPKWKRCKPEALRIERGATLAYLDSTNAIVQLVAGKKHRPRVALADTVPCPECGSDMESADSLVCGDCSGGSHRCCACSASLNDDECHTSDDGSCYCEDCYSDTFSCCEDCSREMVSEDATNVGDRYVCARCLSRNYTQCAHCDEYAHDGDCTPVGSEQWCDGCVVNHSFSCESCEERRDDDDQEDVDGACLCPECAEEKREELQAEEDARLSLLHSRLLRSPRYLRAISGRLALRLFWADVTSADLSAFAPADRQGNLFFFTTETESCNV